MAGHMNIVELLVQNMSPEDLEITDDDGFTALAVAIISNATRRIAECMVGKNARILTIKGYNMLPVAMAFRYGHKELGRYLYLVSLKDCPNDLPSSDQPPKAEDHENGGDHKNGDRTTLMLSMSSRFVVGQMLFPVIRDFTSAKIAWET
ncbi:hypothetical protein FEM48_ZijujUnG0064000 [Ziziphus jujuba var. spinosa]|uniref:Uncharacterized protein n=1 Tax=Ziziphus jujuba var. spinosa TaxID=714518 RepID=A0A978U8X7_ZIZJJ|nr:hypothetical protein FEM48_ZijujUnG0064000 [Ziziphus jujuba var. spinosa]